MEKGAEIIHLNKLLTGLFTLVIFMSIAYTDEGSKKWAGYWDVEKRPEKHEHRQTMQSTNLFRATANMWIRSYQEGISTQDLPSCNFHPSCSRFAQQSILKYGLLKGWLLAGDRLIRCNQYIKNYYPYDYGFDGEKFTDPVKKYDF